MLLIFFSLPQDIRLSKETFLDFIEMFRIQYASNLFVHQNYTWKQAMKCLTPGKAENLALLGNIGHPTSQKTKDFVRWCSDNWNQVYCVPGALELQTKDNLHGLFKTIPQNVHILDQSEKQVGRFVLMGLPVWSAYGPKIARLNSLSERDQYFMARKTYQQIQHFHEEDMEWLQERLKYNQIFQVYNHKCIILLTHWLPSRIMLGYRRYEDRDIYLHVGNTEQYFNKNVAACLSGAGQTTLTEILGNSVNPMVYCGVNSAFCGPHMVPNSNYNPGKVFEIPVQKDPPVYPEGMANRQTQRFVHNFTKYLPKPLVVDAYPNLQ